MHDTDMDANSFREKSKRQMKEVSTGYDTTPADADGYDPSVRFGPTESLDLSESSRHVSSVRYREPIFGRRL